MKNIVVISFVLASILLSSIMLTSICNIKKLIISIELSEEDETKSKNRSNSNTLNLTEEEEHHTNETFFLSPNLKKIKKLKLFYLTKQLSLVFLDILTPPPL